MTVTTAHIAEATAVRAVMTYDRELTGSAARTVDSTVAAYARTVSDVMTATDARYAVCMAARDLKSYLVHARADMPVDDAALAELLVKLGHR